MKAIRLKLNKFLDVSLFFSSLINLDIIFLSFPLAFIYGRWYVTSILVFILFYFFIFDKFENGSRIFIKRKIALTLMLAAGIIATIKAPTLGLGVSYFIGTIVIPIFIFITITNIKISYNLINNFIKLNIVAGIILGSFSIFIVSIIGSVNVRLPSLWEDFNILAAYYMITFFFILASMIHSNSVKQLLLYSISVIPILLGLFLTQTRGVWLSLLIGVAFYILKRPKVLLPASVLIIPIMFIFYSIVLDRFLSVKNFGSDGSALGRIQAWVSSVIIIKNNWLLGVGFDSYRFMRDSVFDTYIVDVLHSHNTYLRLWLEMGIIGFLPYISFLFLALFYTFKLTKYYKKDKNMLKVIEPIQLSFIGLLAAFMFEPYFSLYGNSTIIIWFLISIVFNYYGNMKKLNSSLNK